MIGMITGVMGGGKGIITNEQILLELEHGKRPILTNFAIQKQAWVTADYQLRLGLEAYLTKIWDGNRVRARLACNRVILLTDEQVADFFLWRAFPNEDGTWVLKQADATYKTGKDGERVLLDFDTTLLNTSVPHLYIIDEAWKFWSARKWMKTGEGVQFYTRQHRKCGDDVYISTQHTKDIDAQIVRVVQEFWVCRNRGTMSLGSVFRQPDDFKVFIYSEAPTGANQTPMRTEKYKLNRERASCYDTSAGVGMGGKLSADSKKKKRGLPFWYLYPLGVIVPIIFWFLLSKGLNIGVAKATSAGQGAMNRGASNYLSAATSIYGVKPATNQVANITKLETNKPWPSLIFSAPDFEHGGYICQLSDGKTYRTAKQEIRLLRDDGVAIGTNWYPRSRIATAERKAQEPWQAPSYRATPSYNVVTAPHVQEKPSEVIVFGKRPPRQVANKPSWMGENMR